MPKDNPPIQLVEGVVILDSWNADLLVVQVNNQETTPGIYIRIPTSSNDIRWFMLMTGRKENPSTLDFLDSGPEITEYLESRYQAVIEDFRKKVSSN